MKRDAFLANSSKSVCFQHIFTRFELVIKFLFSNLSSYFVITVKCISTKKNTSTDIEPYLDLDNPRIFLILLILSICNFYEYFATAFGIA